MKFSIRTPSLKRYSIDGIRLKRVARPHDSFKATSYNKFFVGRKKREIKFAPYIGKEVSQIDWQGLKMPGKRTLQ